MGVEDVNIDTNGEEEEDERDLELKGGKEFIEMYEKRMEKRVAVEREYVFVRRRNIQSKRERVNMGREEGHKEGKKI